MGPGSQHAGDYTCADCHMGQAVNAQGETYVSPCACISSKDIR